MDSSYRARLRAGDEAAFGELFDDHARVVHRHAYRWTGCWSTAEDVVSLTFLEAWRLRGKLRPDGDSVLPWLLGIATNVLRNTNRAARRHRAALARVPRADTAPDFADEVTDRMDDADRVASVTAALRTLRPAEREVFALCVWSGLDYATAAEALGVPIGTVRSRLSRARTKLRALAEQALAPGLPPPSAREPAPVRGQVQGGRAIAARSIQEMNR
ncbi:RNA polymerase sigma factor [Micromonospora sp. RTGN7]|uniref:RNA polymerase sigma factor n=1 Tax=Micromonospora sp. RTGN7 TaxID=3016526 RepID=UPI0029FEE466|nr:RNA polymerase sigma factor [Micromonospora sp. RTGN7]